MAHDVVHTPGQEGYPAPRKPSYPPIKPLQLNPPNMEDEKWAGLFIPIENWKIILVKQGITCAAELHELFTDESDLKTLLKEQLDPKKEINIIQRQKFIKSVINYNPNNPNGGNISLPNSPRKRQPHNNLTKQEAEILAKLNSRGKEIRQRGEEIKQEIESLNLKFDAADKAMMEDLEALKQQIEAFKENFKQKLNDFKTEKVDILNEKATKIQSYQESIQECKSKLHANVNSNFWSSIQQRVEKNVEMVNTALINTNIANITFNKTEQIDEISAEINNVKQANDLLRTDCDDEMPPMFPGKDAHGVLSFIPGQISPGSTILEDSICTIVPSQVGKTSIELNIGVGMDNGYDIDDDSKEDAIVYELEMFHNKDWRKMITKTCNAPTTTFRLDGLRKQPYTIRVKYSWKKNGQKHEQYSDKTIISLNTPVIWNVMKHGDNVEFVENHVIKCKAGGGQCSVAMDPMMIRGNLFSKIICCMHVHNYGGKSCFGFIDSKRHSELMDGKWNQCFLHQIRKGGDRDGIYGLSASLNSKQQIFCCKDGKYVQPIKLAKNKVCKNKDLYIFEFVFDKNINGTDNWCNVYKNDSNDPSNLLLSGNCKKTFEKIPHSVMPMYSHEDGSESHVSIKVMKVQFRQ